MPTFLRAFDRLLSALESAFLIIVLVFLVAMTAAVSFMVFARFFLTTSGGWAVEISEYLMVPIALLPASWILKQNGHVALDVVYDRLAPRAQRVMNLIATIFSAVVVSVLAASAVRAVRQAYERNLVLVGFVDMPRYVVFLPIAIGLLLMALRLWRNVVAAFVVDSPVVIKQVGGH